MQLYAGAANRAASVQVTCILLQPPTRVPQNGIPFVSNNGFLCPRLNPTGGCTQSETGQAARPMGDSRSSSLVCCASSVRSMTRRALRVWFGQSLAKGGYAMKNSLTDDGNRKTVRGPRTSAGEDLV